MAHAPSGQRREDRDDVPEREPRFRRGVVPVHEHDPCEIGRDTELPRDIGNGASIGNLELCGAVSTVRREKCCQVGEKSDFDPHLNPP